jgi:hypothetical protein
MIGVASCFPGRIVFLSRLNAGPGAEETSCPGFLTDLILTSFAVRRESCSAPLSTVSRTPSVGFVRSRRE